MEELIRQIIAVEDKAQEVVRAAREADAELSSRINRDIITLQNNIEQQTKQKNASLVQLEEDDATQKISAINSETKRTMAALEEKYNQNKDKWVSEIVSGVIGG